MGAQINEMKNLIKYLPIKDRKYGQKFIETRNFEALKEIVIANITKLPKVPASDCPKRAHTLIKYEGLVRLKNILDDYITAIIGPVDNTKNSYDEFYDSYGY